MGNALEVKEAIDILAGRAGGDLLEVSLTLGGFMLHLAGKAETPEEGQRMMKQAIDSGAGLEKLKQMIAAQGGDPAVCDAILQAAVPTNLSDPRLWNSNSAMMVATMPVKMDVTNKSGSEETPTEIISFTINAGFLCT